LQAMPELIRLHAEGSYDFGCWLEDFEAVTFTINSDPQLRLPLTSYGSKAQREEAVEKFARWLSESYGIQMDRPAQRSIADELSRLTSLLQDGAISQSEFEQAKRKILE